MKKVFIIIVCLVSVNNYSQCFLSDILPFKLGQSKFEVIKIVNSTSSVDKWTDLYNSNRFDNGWQKYDYLKNDSIYRNVIKLSRQKDQCFNGNENLVYLSLADDKLYEATIVQKYSGNRFNDMMTDFSNYLGDFVKNYPYDSSFIISNTKTNEKIGEGVNFYKLPKEKRSNIKIEVVSISYTIQYKSVYNSDIKKLISTSEIESCQIKIETVNLKGTKLTNQGF